jgi:hypothetical protein
LLSPQSATIQNPYAIIAFVTRRNFQSMNLYRLILAVLQPLLALLLIAGSAQAETCLFEDNDRVRIIETAADAVGTLGDRIVTMALKAQATPDDTDDDPGFGSVLPSSVAEPVLGQSRPVINGRTAYPTAPPSHRPRATLSTGPPLV